MCPALFHLKLQRGGTIGNFRTELVDLRIIKCINTKVMVSLLQHFPTLCARLKVGFPTHRLFVQLTSLKVSEKWTDVTEGRFSWETDG